MAKNDLLIIVFPLKFSNNDLYYKNTTCFQIYLL